MNNFKKVGISALAGSLAMFSVNADIVLSGSSEFTYSSNSGSTGGTNANSGNPFGMSNDINITGSGELDNGFTYSVNTNFAGQDMAPDSSILTIDMGDLGTLGFDQGSGAFGISTLENEVPTAYEEADHGVGTLGHGIDAVGNTNVIGYSNTVSGVGISLQINPDISTQAAQGTQAGGTSGEGKTGSNYNFAVTMAVPEVDGLTLAAGYSETDNIGTATDNEEMTAAINYTMGAVSVGYQQSVVDNNGGSTGAEVTAYGIAFNVNENLSISYSINDNEKMNASAAHVTEESKGYQAAYSMGSASVRVAFNEADNVGGVTAAKAENTEISLSLAF
jgi:outer membrane protein OmpU